MQSFDGGNNRPRPPGRVAFQRPPRPNAKRHRFSDTKAAADRNCIGAVNTSPAAVGVDDIDGMSGEPFQMSVLGYQLTPLPPARHPR